MLPGADFGARRHGWRCEVTQQRLLCLFMCFFVPKVGGRHLRQNGGHTASPLLLFVSLDAYFRRDKVSCCMFPQALCGSV